MNRWWIIGTKNILGLLLGALLLFSTQVEVSAKDKPEVIWSPNIFSINTENSRDRLLEYPGIKRKITNAISRKLTQLEAKGDLPFTLKTKSDVGTLNDIYLGSDVALIPVVLLDDTYDRTYHSVDRQNTYYASCINSGLTLMLCGIEENDNPDEEASISFRMLGMIPLYTQSWIGNPKVEIVKKPITREIKATAFAQITANTIERYLDFSKQKRILKNIDAKMNTDDTYQVTEVNISSNKVKELFSNSNGDGATGYSEEVLKNVAAYFYTGAYQQSSKNILLPPNVISSKELSTNVVNNISSLHLDSVNGVAELVLPQAKNKIKLNITGFNSAEVHDKTSNEMVQNIIYKGWMARDNGVLGKKIEMDESVLVKKLRNDPAAVDIAEQDVCLDIMVALAQDLGNEK